MKTHQKRILQLKSPKSALQALFDRMKTKRLGYEEISIQHSVGRILATDIYSPIDIPPFQKTFVDGFAVRSIDTRKATSRRPSVLHVVNELYPNDFPTRTRIRHGQTAYAACGAPIPRGADAVVKVEATRRRGNIVEVFENATVGQHISKVGEDIEKNQLILRKKHVIRPQDIAFLCGVGKRKVRVVRKPKIAIISVGDEIVDFASNTKGIPNNYALLISALASEIGADPIMMGVAQDRLKSIEELIQKSLEKADIVTTIAGCSVGEKDFVPDAINNLGKPGIVFHGVRIKPGHVTGGGIIKGKPVLMLPGHIVSAVVAFYLFLGPLVNLLGGGGALPSLRAKMKHSVDPGGFPTFLRLRLEKTREGYLATYAHGGSNLLGTLLKANGYSILPPGEDLKKNEEVTVTLFTRHELDHIG